jgi:hypothetical protein
MHRVRENIEQNSHSGVWSRSPARISRSLKAPVLIHDLGNRLVPARRSFFFLAMVASTISRTPSPAGCVGHLTVHGDLHLYHKAYPANAGYDLTSIGPPRAQHNASNAICCVT